ncbi:MAG: hypothetical protein TREMPRED_001293 [Tremellales sp. Tagirdzhanova-0007]|nr:MAG: hypothetical protein TREMPRED_001293 [Tremellales sp. Tagirdzhanova-0007]
MPPKIKRERSSVKIETILSPPAKRRRASSSAETLRKFDVDQSEYGPRWADWPAPRQAMQEARQFILQIVEEKRLIGGVLVAGTLLYQTLVHLGHPPSSIQVHHLAKGLNVHSDEERDRMTAYGAERIVLLDQGSRPGRALIQAQGDDDWPDKSQVLTACHTLPIATAALLTYMLLRDLHPKVRIEESWRAVVGVIGDLGPAEAKWGSAPWPSDLGEVLKRFGTKSMSDAVACINAPRRTAEYDVPKAWDTMLMAKSPAEIASNAYLKLCKLDVRDETEKWARTAPRFSLDGRVAVVTIESGFQIHPVIATRWAGNLGRKSKKLIMVMCANNAFNPNPAKVSFSCRIAASLRSLPEGERRETQRRFMPTTNADLPAANLIALLNEYGDGIEGFRQRVGGDYARGHKEATGGIIPKVEFALLLEQMGVPGPGSPRKSETGKTVGKRKVIDPKQTNGIRDFFRAAPPKESAMIVMPRI